MPLALSFLACHKGGLEEVPPTPYLDSVDEVDAFNETLARLAMIFPEHNGAMIREVMLTTSARGGVVSHIAAASDELTTRPPDLWGRPRSGPLKQCEYFRSAEYRVAVWGVLKKEFPAVMNTEIMEAVEENNWDYVQSRAHMSRVLAVKDTRSSFSLLRFRRPIAMPVSSCPELDREVAAFYDTHYPRIAARNKGTAVSSDDEYPFECQCCFRDVPQTEKCFCSEFHNFCRECLHQYVEGIVYGNNSASGLDHVRGSVHCIASGTETRCISSIAPAQLAEFLGPRLLRALEDKLARDAIRRAGINTLSCPFCRYVVEDATAEPPPVPEVKVDALTHILTLLELANGDGPVHNDQPAAQKSDPWNELLECLFGSPEETPKVQPVVRTIFRCMNPECSRESCVKCGVQWVGTHDPTNCTPEASEIFDVDGEGRCARQAFISHRMDESIKRICMKCSTAFIKDSGCNRVVCPCGQKICYVCRADLTPSDYDHFCEHFRSVPDEPCKECDKCLLYVEEDVDHVLGEAERLAITEWKNGRDQQVPQTQDVTPVLIL